MSPTVREWGHDDLAEDLAASRRKAGQIVATRISIGSFGTHGQMDVLALKPSWKVRILSCYEVKVSRQDFLGDVGSGKYLRYAPFCNRLVFAAPKGMLHRDEIPSGCGLVTRGTRGWHTVMRGTVEGMHDHNTMTAMQSIIFKSGDAPWRERQKASRPERIRRLLGVLDETEWSELINYGYLIGQRVADIITRARRLETDMHSARMTLAREINLDEHDIEDLTINDIARRVLTDRPEKEVPTRVIVEDLTRAVALLEDVKRRAQGEAIS